MGYPSTEDDSVDLTDFERILASPTETFEEGLRFFRGEGLMNAAITRLAEDLNAHKIAYCAIDASAMNLHGYRRFTPRIDILMTAAGLTKFTEELVGRSYRAGNQESNRSFRSTAENVPIEITVSGDCMGARRQDPFVLPDPADFSAFIDGIQTITLEKLVELKLASGTSGPGRLRDIADVQEMIRVLELDAAFAEQIHPAVRSVYLELYSEVQAAKLQMDRPDAD